MENAVRAMFFAIPLSLLAAGAHAQDGERYRLEKTEDGYVRMDTTSGEMSICREEGGNLVCKLAADERRAFEDEQDRLSAKLEALETRVGVLEAAKPKRLEDVLPSEEEFQKTMTLMERFMRGFVDIARGLDDEPKTPAPNRT